MAKFPNNVRVSEGIDIRRGDVQRILRSTDPIWPASHRTYYVVRANGQKVAAKAIVFELTHGASHHGNQAAEALMKLGFTVRATHRSKSHGQKPWTDYAVRGLLVFDDEPPRPSRKVTTRAVAAPRPTRAQKDLLEDAYVRFTPKQLREIVPRHNRLSNCFQNWLTSVGATEVSTEFKAVDVSCVYKDRSCLFELKTCHQQSTQHALREASAESSNMPSILGGPSTTASRSFLMPNRPRTTGPGFIDSVEIGITVELFWLQGENVYTEAVSDHPLAIRPHRLLASA